MKPAFVLLVENSYFIAIDKPSGFLSVPSRMGKADPRRVIGIELQSQVDQPLFPVHRLDEETSGILIFAKSTEAQRILNRAFETHQVQKTYEAITEVMPNWNRWTDQELVNHLVRGKKRSFEAPYGKLAKTKITAIRPLPETPFLIWTLEPLTGRSHQLRVQLAMRGFPLVGDSLYGSGTSFPLDLDLPPQSDRAAAIGLRSVALRFEKGALPVAWGSESEMTVPSWSLLAPNIKG